MNHSTDALRLTVRYNHGLIAGAQSTIPLQAFPSHKQTVAFPTANSEA
jgi:hypothetical protein